MLICHFYKLIISKKLFRKSQFVAIFPTLKLTIDEWLQQVGDRARSEWLVSGW